MKEILTQPFVINALTAGIISSVGLSLLGGIVVLKRNVFVTLAIAETSICGVIVGMFLGINYYLTSIILTLAAIIFFSSFKPQKYIPEESIIASVYVFVSSVSIILISKSAVLQAHATDILSGNMLTVSSSDLILLGIGLLISTTTFLLLYKKFVFIYSDPDTAKVYGLNYELLNFVFYLILGIMISVSIKSLGVLLTFGYILMPTLISLLIFKNLKKLIISNIIFTTIATILGIFLSILLDLPIGPSIVCCLVIFILMNILLKIAKILV